jgi:hypothetical protein
LPPPLVVLDGSLPDATVLGMLEDSYDLVVSALPRSTRERPGWSTGQPLVAPAWRGNGDGGW